MPLGKPKVKTAVMTLRVEPSVKAAAELVAKRNRRSLTNMIEVLILEYCEREGIELPKDITGEQKHEKA